MLKDIQKEEPEFKYPIERVGITNFKLPIFVTQRDNINYQHTVADINTFIDLKNNAKGINMSRLPIALQTFLDSPLNRSKMNSIADYIINKCEAERCQLIYKFPYFIKKIAPISLETGIIYTNVEFNLTKNDNAIFKLSVETNVTSLCPCSKEISERSAHNQKSSIKIDVIVKDDSFIWIEDLIEIAEKNSSCEIYSVIKRVDEKHVTEKAYDNAKFVEDMVRGCYNDLNKLDNITNFKVQVDNYESIHQHIATAIMEKI